MALEKYVSQRRLAYFKTKLDTVLATFGVKSVKVNGSALTPDAAGAVDVSVPEVGYSTTYDVDGAWAKIASGAFNASDDAIIFTKNVNGLTVSGSIDRGSDTYGGFTNIELTSKSYVDTKCAEAASGAVSFVQVADVASLPATGVNGTFYLVPNSGSGQNVYDEYVWVNKGTAETPNYAYENLGPIAIDLTNYVEESDLVEITEAEIDAMFA